MATWSSYFSSYVKKTDKQTDATPTQPENFSPKTPPKTLPLGGEGSQIVNKSIVRAIDYSTPDTDPAGFQRSNSTSRKLYDIPSADPEVKGSVQRSLSNAARVAKLFGYANPPPPAKEILEDDFGESIQPTDSTPKDNVVRTIPKQQNIPEIVAKPVAAPPKPRAMAAEPISTQRKMEEKIVRTVPTQTKPKSKDDIWAMLDEFADQAGTPQSKSDTTKLGSSRKTPRDQSENRLVSPAKVAKLKAKEDMWAMLDEFASQAEVPKPKTSNVKAESTRPKPKHQVKPTAKEDMWSMLDEFASQAGTLDAIPQSTKILKTVVPRVEKPIAQKPSLPKSMTVEASAAVDEFASEAGAVNTVEDTVESAPVLETKLKVKKGIWGMLGLGNQTAEPETIPESAEGAKPLDSKVENPVAVKPEIKKDVALLKDFKPTVRATRQDSIASQSSYAPSIFSAASEKSSIPSRSSSVSSSWTTGASESSENKQRVEQEMQEIDEIREKFLEYERQAEKMWIEKERMDLERKRMLEEARQFQEEADRIAVEEAQMQKFVKDVEREREIDRENEERKQRKIEEERRRREAEARLKAEGERRRREEEVRLKAEEERRLREEGERIKAEKEKREKEEARRKAEEGRRLREENARIKAKAEALQIAAQRKAAELDRQEKKRQYELEDERLAREEAERLTAELRKYEQEVEEERRRLEEEEAEVERRTQKVPKGPQYKEDIEADRRRFLEEVSGGEGRVMNTAKTTGYRAQEDIPRQPQRVPDERIGNQRPPMQRGRPERLQYEAEEARFAEQRRRDAKAQADRMAQILDNNDFKVPRGRNMQPDRMERILDNADFQIPRGRNMQRPSPGMRKGPFQGSAPLQRANTIPVDIMRDDFSRGMPQPGRDPRGYGGGIGAERSVSRNNTVPARPQMRGPLAGPPGRQYGAPANGRAPYGGGPINPRGQYGGPPNGRGGPAPGPRVGGYPGDPRAGGPGAADPRRMR